MERRRFIKNVSLGAAASVVKPNLNKGSKTINEIDHTHFRNDNKEYIERFKIIMR